MNAILFKTDYVVFENISIQKIKAINVNDGGTDNS